MKCGWRFDPPTFTSYGTGERDLPQRTIVEIQPDPFDQRQVARWLRAAYEIGCLVQIGAIAGAVAVLAVLALLGHGGIPGDPSVALLELLAVAVGAGVGGYLMLLLLGA